MQRFTNIVYPTLFNQTFATCIWKAPVHAAQQLERFLSCIQVVKTRSNCTPTPQGNGKRALFHTRIHISKIIYIIVCQMLASFQFPAIFFVCRIRTENSQNCPPLRSLSGVKIWQNFKGCDFCLRKEWRNLMLKVPLENFYQFFLLKQRLAGSLLRAE